MLLGILADSLLGNLLTGKGIVRAGSGNKKGKGILRAGTGTDWGFSCCPILSQILKYKSIIKMNQDLMEFFQGIIYLKK